MSPRFTLLSTAVLAAALFLALSMPPLVPRASAQPSCLTLTHAIAPDDSDADVGGEVSKLQRFLADTGFYSGAISGHVGPKTVQAIQAWQKANGPVSSGDPNSTGYGYVGKRTRALMACTPPRKTPAPKAAAPKTTVSDAPATSPLATAALIQSLLDKVKDLQAQIAALISSTNAPTQITTLTQQTTQTATPTTVSAQGGSDTVSTPTSARTLSLGMSGSDVASLQQTLITLDYLTQGNATGYFGRMTQAAVRAFQSDNDIVSSGSPQTTGYGAVDPKTRLVLTRSAIAAVPTQPLAAGSVFATPTNGSAPLTVTFIAPASAGGDYFSFGDGTNGCSVPGVTRDETGCSIPSGTSITHTYIQPGTYEAIVDRLLPSTILARATITVTGSGGGGGGSPIPPVTSPPTPPAPNPTPTPAPSPTPPPALTPAPPPDPNAKYKTTQFGMLYDLWQCDGVYGGRVWDISKALVGNDVWSDIPNFMWWTQPQAGYYCYQTTPNWDDIIKQHAAMLRDAGINFIILDFSNNPRTDWPDAQKTVLGPLARFLPDWNSVPNAPKIVQFTPLTPDGDMFATVQRMLDQYPNLEFSYQGKPLAIAVAGGVDQSKYQQFSNNYTLRQMWGLSQPASNWSFIEMCQSGFRASSGTIPCNQRISITNGVREQIPVVPSYQETYATNVATDVPKFQGRTFVQQFAIAFNNPDVSFVTFSTWNEWISQRYCLINGVATSNGCDTTNDHWPNGMKVFVDDYDAERSRDIEPSATAPYDYYYQLMKDCISKFRNGQMCSASDVPFSAPPTVQYSPNSPTGWLDDANCNVIGGWAQDPDAPTQSIKVTIYSDTGPYPAPIVTLTADGNRPDLCTAIGSCNHGYTYATPASLKDGRPHQVWALGGDNANGSLTMLLGSPKTIQCSLATTPTTQPVVQPAPVPAPVPVAPCAFNNQTIASGQSVTAYQFSSVPFGAACVSETRTCSKGTLSGSYTAPSCVVQQSAIFNPPVYMGGGGAGV